MSLKSYVYFNTDSSQVISISNEKRELTDNEAFIVVGF